MPISQSQYLAMEARRNKSGGKPAGGAVEREKELHESILEVCRQRGWLVFHGSMARRTHRTGGEPDFVILTDLQTVPGQTAIVDGKWQIALSHSRRVLFVECKTATGKLSLEQQEVQSWARKLGHTVHVVRSIEEFRVLCL